MGGDQTIEQVLERLSLSNYIETLKKEEVDVAALKLLSEDDLKDLGVALGGRKKILEWQKHPDAINNVPQEAAAPTSSAAHTEPEKGTTKTTVLVSVHDKRVRDYSDDHGSFINVERSEKIKNIKEKIWEKFTKPAHLQKLDYKGKKLDDDEKTLADYDIPAGEMIVCAVLNQIRVNFKNVNSHPEQTFALDIFDLDLVSNVKQKLQAKTSVLASALRLYYKSQELKDDDCFLRVDNNSEVLINVRTTPATATSSATSSTATSSATPSKGSIKVRVQCFEKGTKEIFVEPGDTFGDVMDKVGFGGTGGIQVASRGKYFNTAQTIAQAGITGGELLVLALNFNR